VVDPAPPPTPPTGSAAVVNGTTSGPTTTSATFSVIPEMTLTGTVQCQPISITFDGDFFVTSTLVLGDSVEISLFVDGVEVPGSRRNISVALGLSLNTGQNLAISRQLPDIMPGIHTIDVRYRRPGATGAARCSGTNRSLSVSGVW
jgi:hypothetical protein